MKLSLSTAIHALLVGAPCVLGFDRTEEVMSDGVVHVTFSNITIPDIVPGDAAAAAVQRRTNDPIYTYSECRDATTYSQTRRYGVTGLLECGEHQKCTVNPGLGARISYSWCGAMDFPQLLRLAKAFQPDLPFANPTVSHLSYPLDWNGPAKKRVYLTQAFVVAEATCRHCYGGPGVREGWCDDWMKSSGELPCDRERTCWDFVLKGADYECTEESRCQLLAG
ncbi:hypothetical protein ISF_07843 [Cordyceps fumosorosea ARSEF 2679]|uniref:Uncharacterized protein n=1 Tax=Cordyceps fumosorosea (strain ARSEF 2679) TaxID=1081104 RepID=A0A167NN25_CORFA|nr:hypothetical protein ISF_07843 [Cordyceps fumosorosea ARSEF 2679]OAA55738.1 hypothetical protein ISF_07843 [Cordyceps fumosorosea ARSEF 2679]